MVSPSQVGRLRINGGNNGRNMRILSSTSDPNSVASPVYRWDEETQQNDLSWQHGLIRRYFPKGTDFHLVSQGAVNEVVTRLNSTPRKVLGYQTPQKFLQLIP